MEHVLADISMVSRHVNRLRQSQDKGFLTRDTLNRLLGETDESEMEAFHAAIHWMQNGMESIFLQDANSLILKPGDLITILDHIRSCFPWASRVTSYARSHTVSRIKDEDLAAIRMAGLSRIHIGMESASDHVLKRIKKGSTKAMHITAGIKAKKAGMELSEYVMPGLGGADLYREHALETADALNAINPDFIRLRSLAIPRHVPLYEDYKSGRFVKATDVMVAEEILLFLENLDGITSMIKSDHILNLFQDVEGRYPEAKEPLTRIIKDFLALPPDEQVLVQVGRRMGIFKTVEDQADPAKQAHVRDVCRAHGINPDTVDQVIEDIMRRFI